MGLLIRLQVVMLGIYLSFTIETRKKDRIEIGLFFSEKFETKTKNQNKDVVQIHHLLMESRKKSLACLPTLSTIVGRRKRCNGADPLISPRLCISLHRMAQINIPE